MSAAPVSGQRTGCSRIQEDLLSELSGLDPFTSEDRERLGLGLKAYRIIEPKLPR